MCSIVGLSVVLSSDRIFVIFLFVLPGLIRTQVHPGALPPALCLTRWRDVQVRTSNRKVYMHTIPNAKANGFNAPPNANSICLSVYRLIYPSTHPFLYQSTHPFTQPFVHQSTQLSTQPFVRPPIRSSTHPSINQSTGICSCICPSACLCRPVRTRAASITIHRESRAFIFSVSLSSSTFLLYSLLLLVIFAGNSLERSSASAPRDTYSLSGAQKDSFVEDVDVCAWKFSLDDESNSAVRAEFFYDQVKPPRTTTIN